MNIISMTTTRVRAPMLSIALTSLQNQTLMPDEIHINVCDQSFKNEDDFWRAAKLNKNSYPNTKIFLVSDIGPHTKLFYTLFRVQNTDKIVVVDDDIKYEPDFFNKIIETRKKYENDVVANLSRAMKKNIFSRYVNYNSMQPVKKQYFSKSLIALGYKGVCYKKVDFHERRLLNKKLLNLLKTNDDLFWMICLKEEVKIFNTGDAEKNQALRHSYGISNENVKNLRKKENPLFKIAKRLTPLFLTRAIKALVNYLGYPLTPNDRMLKVFEINIDRL